MVWKKVKISSFLKERKDRFKPDEARKLGLQRIEKITQYGEIFLSDKPSNTNMIIVKKGDLVLSGIGIAKGGGNSLNIYKGKEDVLATIHYSSYEINKKEILEEFLKIFLISPYFKKLLQDNSPNGIKAEIKPKHFLPIELNLPDFKIQREIIKKIQSMENEIKELETNFQKDETLLTKLKQSILQEAVQGKLVPQNPKDEPAFELLKKIKKEKEKLIKEKKIKRGKELPKIEEDEVPYELPKGWVWCRLGEVCTLITDGTHYTPNYFNEGIPFLSVKNLSNGKIDFSNSKFISEQEHKELTKRCNPEYLDLLLTKVGTTGIAKLIDVKREFSIFVSVALLKYPQNLIYSKYLEYLINSPLVKKQSSEGTEGVGNKNLVLRKIVNFIIPLPPLSEQKRIVAKVDQLMNFCNGLEDQIKENQKGSELLMGAVLREAFSGSFRE